MGRIVQTLVKAGVLVIIGLTMTLEKAYTESWMLTYCHQHGNTVTAGGGIAEIHACYDNGALIQNLGFTNKFNLGSAIWGNTNQYGNLRIYFEMPNNPMDIQVFGETGEPSPYLYWQINQKNYAFELHWRKITDDTNTTTFPLNPVYHWDLIRGLNTETTEVPNFNSDAKEVTPLYEEIWGQTFVVPAGVTHIISAKAFAVTGGGCDPFQLRYSIHQTDPNGAQIGPVVTTRPQYSTEYTTTVAHFPTGAVPVTPGQTYALRIEKVDQGNPCWGGFNMYWTTPATSNNYPHGTAWVSRWTAEGTEPPFPIHDRDLAAVVIGIGQGAAPTPIPTATPIPPTPTNTPTNTPTTVPPSPTATPTQGCTFHTADQTGNWQLDFNLSLLLIQRFNSGGEYSCGDAADGYQIGPGLRDCPPHDTDYNGNWMLDFPEMLRFIQFFNMGYHCTDDPTSPDGYAPGRP